MAAERYKFVGVAGESTRVSPRFTGVAGESTGVSPRLTTKRPARTCVAEPMATPMAMSILFFMAKMTAEACSAALPTIGRMMT